MCYIKNVSRHLKPENSSAVQHDRIAGSVQLKNQAVVAMEEEVCAGLELFCEVTRQKTHDEALLPRGMVTAPR